MPRLSDVAERAGVTASVASRVLNEDETLRVRDETRQRVVAAAQELDYTPNHAARALRQSKVGTLGLAVHDISNPVYAPLIAGAQRAASASGYVLMLTDVPELARDEEVFRRVVGSRAIDGLLLLPAGDDADQVVERAVATQLPTVMVNDRSGTLPSIGLPDRRGMEVATEHLLQLGHRDLALLQLDGTGHRATERTAGFRRAMRRAGATVPRRLVRPGGHTVEAGRRGMARLLDRGSAPTGVVVASVLAAVGAMAAGQERGLRVPEDLSVVGFHDVFFAPFLTPALSVVHLPLDQLGSRGVERLLTTIDDPSTSGHETLDAVPELVDRGSTGPPPGWP